MSCRLFNTFYAGDIWGVKIISNNHWAKRLITCVELSRRGVKVNLPQGWNRGSSRNRCSCRGRGTRTSTAVSPAMVSCVRLTCFTIIATCLLVTGTDCGVAIVVTISATSTVISPTYSFMSLSLSFAAQKRHDNDSHKGKCQSWKRGHPTTIICKRLGMLLILDGQETSILSNTRLDLLTYYAAPCVLYTRMLFLLTVVSCKAQLIRVIGPMILRFPVLCTINVSVSSFYTN